MSGSLDDLKLYRHALPGVCFLVVFLGVVSLLNPCLVWTIATKLTDKEGETAIKAVVALVVTTPVFGFAFGQIYHLVRRVALATALVIPPKTPGWSPIQIDRPEFDRESGNETALQREWMRGLNRVDQTRRLDRIWEWSHSLGTAGVAVLAGWVTAIAVVYSGHVGVYLTKSICLRGFLAFVGPGAWVMVSASGSVFAHRRALILAELLLIDGDVCRRVRPTANRDKSLRAGDRAAKQADAYGIVVYAFAGVLSFMAVVATARVVGTGDGRTLLTVPSICCGVTLGPSERAHAVTANQACDRVRPLICVPCSCR